MNTQTFTAITVLCAALAFPAWAQKGQEHGNHSKDRGGDSHGAAGQQHRPDSAAPFAVDDRDRSAISSYYRGEFARGNCPPGLAKKENGCLPPGLAKKVWAVDRALPPAIMYYPLPPELYSRLTPPPAGYQYVRVDDDVLLMQTVTRSVVNQVVNLR
jgi:hypothetical protein